MMSRPRIGWRIAVLAATILPLLLIGFALAQPPGFPRPPQMPRPPFGPFGPGMGLEKSTTYTCQKCGTVQTISRPIDDHDKEAHCLKCGARLDAPEMTPPPNMKPKPDGRNPADEGAGRGQPNIPNPNPGPGNDPPPNQFNNPGKASTTSTTSGNAAPTGGRMGLVVLIIFIVGGLLLLLAIAGIAAVVYMVSTTPGAGGSRVRRRRSNPRYDPV